MFGRNRHGVTPEAMIEAREAAKPPVEGAVVGPDGVRRLPRTYPAGRDHRADSPDLQRDRRRKGLAVVLDERFTLSEEVAVIFGPVAARLSAVPEPGRWAGRLDRVLRADAVARQEDWTAANVALRDIARLVRMPIAEVPRFDPQSLADGSWVAVLVDACRPLDVPVSEYLGREGMRREQSRARGVEPEPSPVLDHLRVLDRAALALDRELSRLTASSVPAAVGVDPMDALRRKHSREQEELRARQAAEWAEASAAVKAARLAQVAHA
ncbi:hypothetical protein [Nocardia farcinica]|uniref:hypothetical protein n=1 Tax=Nocardia farcinica TaxID=37329 RepID=UPI0018936DE1|nr:hypothetical protein [Nocardia farcinica]MBF6070140.1 hypothetical protein [Nocardia farcinica]